MISFKIKMLLKSLFYLLKRIFLYPFFVKNKYHYANSIISNIIDILSTRKKDSVVVKNLIELRSKYVKLINFLIVFPVIVGFFLFFLTAYLNKSAYIEYFNRIALPLKGDGFVDKSFSAVKRIRLAVKFHPVSVGQIQWILYGFSFSFVGAAFLTLNPLFSKSKDIEDVLKKMNKVDQDGNPWTVFWTPDVIYFETFNCDPFSFQQEKKFWNTINFSPEAPILSVSKKYIFLVEKKYELPDAITFNIK